MIAVKYIFWEVPKIELHSEELPISRYGEICDTVKKCQDWKFKLIICIYVCSIILNLNCEVWTCALNICFLFLFVRGCNNLVNSCEEYL